MSAASVPLKNLDFECFSQAEKASATLDEKLVGDAMAVLTRQGPFACVLYLESEAHKKGQAEKVNKVLGSVSEVLKLVDSTTAETPGKVLEKIQKDLPKLLLAQRLLLQFFTYLRYQVKANQ